MKILLIQFSDLHLKDGNNSLSDRKESILAAVQNLALKADETFAVICGDIAWAGSEAEYLQAVVLFDYFRDKLRSYTTKPLKFVIVPGNHDCNFSEPRKIRATLIQHVQKNGSKDVDDEVIDQCCKIQEHYFAFEECYPHQGKILKSDKLLTIAEYQFEQWTIVFHCFNTAWMSELDEQPGKAFFPIERYKPEFATLEADMSVAVLHHTFKWQNPNNARNFASYVEETCDIVLTGHEHISSKSLKNDLEGNYTEYIEGGVLQDHSENPSVPSAFNVVLADLEKRVHKIYGFSWNGSFYSSKDNETDWLPLRRGRRMPPFVYEINPQFVKFLDDPGAPYKHPNKTQLVLSDIFVFPHLRDMMKVREERTDFLVDIVDGDILCRLDDTENRIVLLGDENSGKSALCRMLFKRYHEQRYVPIYVDAHRIRTTSTDGFDRLLSRCFKEQYNSQDMEKFEQLQNDRKVVIIDGFDEARLNLRCRSVLLRNINASYPNVIITGNDLFQISEIVCEEKDEGPLHCYNQYGILAFGNLLRSKIIDKWYLIGTDEEISEDELIRANDNAFKIINTVIGKNLVPSYPFFLLIILQTIEAGRPHNLHESAYGHYYQILVGQAIAKIGRSNDKIDAYHNYLTELANHLSEKRTYYLSRDEFFSFHKWFCDEYAISSSFEELINFDMLVNNLTTVGILETKNGLHGFRYKFMYYFFAAKYLANSIGDTKVQTMVSEMCKRLYRSEFAHIILFLTHHTKDQFVLNQVLSNAKQLFGEYEPTRLEDDISAFNKLLDEVPKLVLKNRGVHEAREEVRRLQDALPEPEPDEDEEIPDWHEELVALDMVSTLNVAFKTIELMGQILKNYHGSLKRDMKLALGEETYILGLRAMNPLFQLLAKNTDYLVSRINTIIEKKGLLGDKDRVERQSENFLFAFCSCLAFAFIKKIATSVGSEHLSETFREIEESHTFTSVKLIDMAIKLEFYRNFPFKETKQLQGELDDNVLPLTLLKLMVVDHLYMFETNHTAKQRICSMLGISVETQRLIEMKSSARRKLI